MVNTDCDLCDRDDDQEACGTRSPRGSYRCTRPTGHDGEHIACGVDHCDHPIVRWEPGDEVEAA